MPRLPWTIWRYLLAELWRLLLLSTAILVLVISFAATAKPLMDGKLSAWTALKFMLYAVPPMLQYALPFSACLAAVLAYHRFATDNELTAARAGGLSYRRVLAPAAITGLTLTLFMLVLGESVIPRFLRAMQTTITQDVASVIRSSVQDGRPLDFGNFLVHADEARSLGPDTQSGAHERLMLTRPVALQVGRDGSVEGATTASVAWVWLKSTTDESTGQGATRVDINLEQATGSQQGRARGSGGLWLRRDVTGSLRDSAKYKTYRQLRELPIHPDRSNVVDSSRRELALQLARHRVAESMDEALRAGRPIRLLDADGRVYLIRAAGLQAAGSDDSAWRLLAPPQGRVELEVLAPGAAPGSGRQLSARGGLLRHEGQAERARGSLSLALSLSDVTVRAQGRDTATSRAELGYAELSPEVNPLPGLLGKPSAALLEAASAIAQGPGQEGPIASVATELKRRVDVIGREVRAKIHERWAIAVTALVMVICGAVTAIRLANRLPLVVYAWCFFPALVAVLSVNVGQAFAIDVGTPGIITLWSGLAGLGVYTLWTLRRISRN